MLRIPDEVATVIQRLHPGLKRKVRASLEILVAEPHAGKALKEELSGLRSLRVGRLRIIYRISRKKQIEVVAIGPRQRIYEETYKLLSKGV